MAFTFGLWPISGSKWPSVSRSVANAADRNDSLTSQPRCFLMFEVLGSFHGKIPPKQAACHIYILCVYMYILYICIHVYMYICIYVYMYMYIYVYVYICKYEYVYICIYAYICINACRFCRQIVTYKRLQLSNTFCPRPWKMIQQEQQQQQQQNLQGFHLDFT